MTKPLLEKTLTTFMKTANKYFLLRIQFFEVWKKLEKENKFLPKVLPTWNSQTFFCKSQPLNVQDYFSNGHKFYFYFSKILVFWQK